MSRDETPHPSGTTEIPQHPVRDDRTSNGDQTSRQDGQAVLPSDHPASFQISASQTELEPAGVELPLPERIRAYLAGMPTGDLPITYGQLARTMGLVSPGSIATVTHALEVTMFQDARSGAPFIASLVVGKVSGSVPGRGFFEKARSLGRGPELGEDDCTFHRRVFTAVVSSLMLKG